MRTQGHKDLNVFQKAYAAAMWVFEINKSFSKEEQYPLTDQVRRSSRSGCTDMGEVYRKRIYPKHFVSTLSDSDGECTQTPIFLDFAFDCSYLTKEQYTKLTDEYTQIGKMLASMMQTPETFFPKEKPYGLPTLPTNILFQ